MHIGKTAADVVVNESSIKDVTNARGKLLEDGVSVDHSIQGFADATVAEAAKAVQESASDTLVDNLKAEGFSSLTQVTSTVAVLDANGNVAPTLNESGVAGVWASWTWTMMTAAVALVVVRR